MERKNKGGNEIIVLLLAYILSIGLSIAWEVYTTNINQDCYKYTKQQYYTMPFVKGDTRINKAGRPTGALNRTTEMMRLNIARAVNNTLDTIQTDLAEIKKTNPEKAMELAMKLMEYSLPKLRSIDIQGSMEVNAKIQQISININRTGSKDELGN